jgi:hypothetical protein
MPALFNRFGIHFQYPENWTLETESSAPGRQTVSVYSPGCGFWTVALAPSDSDPAQLAETALDAIKREYDELDSEKASETIGDVYLVGYDLNFYCLDLTNTAWIRAGRTSRAAYLVICQAEDREFDQISPVFRAMTTSLLSGNAERDRRSAGTP